MICVYKISSKIKPERVYIGSSVNYSRRKAKHKTELKYNYHHSIKLQNHMNKYGLDDLIWSIVSICNRDNIIEIEQYYIDFYKPYFNTLLTAYSFLGYKVSEETRIKHRSYRHSKESIEKLKNSYTEERKRLFSEKYSGKNATFFGKKHSQETKDKISKAHMGKKMSKECIDKRSNSRSVPIICLTNNIIYKSAKEAGKILKLRPGNITSVCRGNRKTHKGYTFTYYKL